MKTPNQTFEGYVYKVNRRKRGLPFVRRKRVARHRNYRLVLGFRSRYCQKTKTRLPLKNYRCMALPPKIYHHILFLPPPPKSLPPKKRNTAYRRKTTAVWHYHGKITTIFWFYRLRQSRYRQKSKNRLSPKHYRRMTLPPRLCPPKKALQTITLIFYEQMI